MRNEANERGRSFEGKVAALLEELARANPGLVEITTQPELRLLNGQIKRPDFEIVYRLEQEHHELIECQSRERSSAEIADKIRNIKSLSSRNRFVFVFEEPKKLRKQHKAALESDGVNCLSFKDFVQKIKQIDLVLTMFRHAATRKSDKGTRFGTPWEELLRSLADEGPNFDRSAFTKPYRGPS